MRAIDALDLVAAQRERVDVRRRSLMRLLQGRAAPPSTARRCSLTIALSSFSRSFATTSGAALATNCSLASLFPARSTSPLRRTSFLSLPLQRAARAARGRAPRQALPQRCARAGRCVRAFARREVGQQRRVGIGDVRRHLQHRALSLCASPASARRLRMRSTRPLQRLRSVAAAARSRGTSSGSGQVAVTIVSPSCGSASQISSLMNGAIGWSKRIALFQTNESTAARVAAVSGVPSSLRDTSRKTRTRRIARAFRRRRRNRSGRAARRSTRSSRCRRVRIHRSARVSCRRRGSVIAAGQTFGQGEHVAQRVPDLIVEVARLFAARLLETHLLAFQTHLTQNRDAKGIGAVAFRQDPSGR